MEKKLVDFNKEIDLFEQNFDQQQKISMVNINSEYVSSREFLEIYNNLMCSLPIDFLKFQ